MTRRLLSILLAGCAGCSLFSKAELPPTRYFRPGPVAVAPAPGEGEGQAPAPRPLRFREVTAADHLRERMVWTSAPVEYGFYELALWTEPPAAFAEAALGAALFERGAFRRASGADAATLDVRLFAFEEVVTGDRHEARVGLRVLLVGVDGHALVERTVTATRPIAAQAEVTDHAAVAAALGVALDDAVKAVVILVDAALHPG